jgi:hypothetical protein
VVGWAVSVGRCNSGKIVHVRAGGALFGEESRAALLPR